MIDTTKIAYMVRKGYQIASFTEAGRKVTQYCLDHNRVNLDVFVDYKLWIRADADNGITLYVKP